MNFIDTHAHVFSKYDQCIETARYTPNYDASVEQFISHLDAHMFTHGVLVQPSFFGTDNHVMLDAIKQFPNRLKGIAVVDIAISLDELTELKNQGIVGIRLNLFGLPVPHLNTTEWKQFLAHLEKLEFQIELHAPPAYLLLLLPQFNQYDLNIVIDHFGRIDSLQAILEPEYQDFLQLLNPHQHWIKVSGFYRLGSSLENIEIAQQAYVLLKQQGLMKRLIWGSDWPHTQYESIVSYESTVQTFKKIVTDEKEQYLILSENATHLFKF